MIEKGWIPAFVPPDARDIHLEGDLDSASVYGEFLAEDTRKVREHCSKSEGAIHWPEQPPKWFPLDLQSGGRTANPYLRGYEIFTCDAGVLTTAILEPDKKVFYWNRSRR